MLLDLTLSDIDALITSLRYSKQRVGEAQETVESVRKENVDNIDALVEKLRNARQRAATDN